MNELEKAISTKQKQLECERVILKAMKKQKPEPPKVKGERKNKKYYCMCGHELEPEVHLFCSRCGQHIDWYDYQYL